MNEMYLCPDCRDAHAEPYEAALGHLARCMSCVLLLEVLAEAAALDADILDIRVAA